MASQYCKPSRRDVLLALGAAAVPALGKIGSVEIGVCGSLDDFPKAEAFGFDYFEPAAAAVAALSDSAFAETRKRILDSRLRCLRFNSFIRTLTVVGPDVKQQALTEYLKSTLDRCRQLGARTVVWGSASSRNVPEGYSREEAWSQIKSFLTSAGEIARSQDIVIAIEPLRKQESNIINSGAEALRLVEEVSHPNVKMIIDYYHMRVEHESPEILEKARAHIVHLHFANPAGRVWPKSSDEDAEYGRFFSILKRTGYQGGLSIEGRGTFEQDAPGSLAFFRNELS